jgi:hypothetical protein
MNQGIEEMAKHAWHGMIYGNFMPDEPIGQSTHAALLDIQRVQRGAVQQGRIDVVVCGIDTEGRENRQAVLRAKLETVGIVHYEVKHIAMRLNNALGPTS